MKISGVDRCRLVNSIERPSRALPSDRTFQPSSSRTLFRTTPTCTNPIRSSVERERETERRKRERESGATADFPPSPPTTSTTSMDVSVPSLWLCFRIENLLEGKDSPPRGIVIGNPEAFRPFQPRLNLFFPSSPIHPSIGTLSPKDTADLPPSREAKGNRGGRILATTILSTGAR